MNTETFKLVFHEPRAYLYILALYAKNTKPWMLFPLFFLGVVFTASSPGKEQGWKSRNFSSSVFFGCEYYLTMSKKKKSFLVVRVIDEKIL